MKKLLLSTALVLVLLSGIHAQKGFPYQDPGLPVQQRVDDLLSRMTLDEKIGQMSMLSLRNLKTDKNGNVSEASLKRLFQGHSTGCLESPFIGVEEIAKYSEAADKYLRENTRLGIPAIQIAECLHGQLAFGATIFPQAIAQGSTWNPDLIRKMAEVIAAEASLSGVDQALSPLFDLARDPRYGRVEECYGEDPYLVAEMGKAFVTGMQGSPEITKDHIPDGHLMCTAKHFVAYSTPVAGINLGPNEVGERYLRSLHLYTFRKAVQEAHIYAVMPSYNEMNGIPLHANAGLFDRPYHSQERISERDHTENSIRLAREIAEESVVLLKNEDHLLPLKISDTGRSPLSGPMPTGFSTVITVPPRQSRRE